MKKQEFLHKFNVEAKHLDSLAMAHAWNALERLLGEAKEIFTDVELEQIGSVEIKADNLSNGNDRLNKAFDERFKQATGGRKWTGTTGAVPMYQCGVPGKVIGFFLPVECDGVKPPSRVKYTIEEVPPVVKPAPSPPAPTKCEPWPPAQNLLNGFAYEVGGKLFTLYRHHGVDRVQLKMSRSTQEQGIVTECVATIGKNVDTLVNCEFEHISAVAAAIPRAEVFIRNLYEKKSAADHNHERHPLPDGCEWVDGVFRVRDNMDATLYMLPANERQASILEALAREFRRTKLPNG